MPDDPDHTDEQEKREQDPIRQRVRAALLKPSRSQVVVGVLLALVGFAAVTQVRENQTEDSYAGLREQDLIDVLAALAGTRQRAEEEIAELEQVRDQLRSETTRRQAALEQAQQELDELSILAGTVPVTGPGIRVTIEEEEGTVELASLLDTIQELRTADAEAIQINLVRVVAQTSFAPAEGGFLVDGKLVEAPYVIDVIGEPNVLQGAIDFPLGPKAQLAEDGAEVEVEALTSLDIEAVAQPVDPQEADPAEGQ